MSNFGFGILQVKRYYMPPHVSTKSGGCSPACRTPHLDTATPDTYTLPFALTAKLLIVASAAHQHYKFFGFPTEFQKMPNHKSAEKRMRQNERRKSINRSNRTRLRTEIKKLRAAITVGDKDALQAVLSQTISSIDKSVQKGVLHRNAAARYKSRLTTRVNQIGAQ
ncbi:MAG: 30S ribosomal protein S20 [Pyrinomonadaceae bacterium]